ncbi:MAG: hypothetical protein JJ908_10540 [Rhizobiales bacterium]|jgi:hypothetical protein|nr:hypothetical protein [Hyphomicrobiales bacterium]MBO6699258.1 hypothetical protein [Hyphomicrobiales bacterium]MBO6736796.1 hypothetical protein [Hyphomicrobiales bacterium]MBO6912130.1 hypothetical protein [Hyphomicrobiales bacterium]MBO6956964.1 hypothetical protein [Hyphomicrobiales bacterium]
MSNAVNRFLGGSPLGVFVKLLLISLLVGVVLSALGLTPLSLVEFVVDFFQRIWNLGFEALGQFGDWILLGATLVIPVWFIMRLMDRSNR